MPNGESGICRCGRGVFAVAAALAFLTIGCPTMLAFTARAAVNPVPVLAVRLDSANQNARVTESSPGIVTFTGQASIDKLPVEYCVVTLNSSTDIGWISLVSPSTAVFTSTTPQSFTCTVIVPPGTPNSEYGNLVINGRAVAGGMQSAATTKGIIAVDPYFRLNLSSATPYMEILPGRQAFLTVWLNNTGNAVDSFELEINNLKDLAAQHWIIVLVGGCIPKVSPGESKPFRIVAQSPREDALWKSEPMVIIIKATSQNAEDFQQVVSTTFQLTVYVRGTWLPSLFPYGLLIPLAILVAYLATRLRRERKKRR